MNTIIKNSLYLILSLLLLAGCSTETNYPEITLGKPAPDTIELKEYPSSDYGYVIYDPEKKSIRISHNINSLFMPASVTKLFTTVLALEVLTPDYRFTTELLHSGRVIDGEIEGDLLMKGSGDPDLSTEDLLDMIQKLKNRGIRKVRGRFFYDIESFTTKEVLDEGMPDNARYNTGLGPLNLNRNLITAVKKSGEEQNRAYLYLVPSLPSNRVFTYDSPPVLLFARYSNSSGIETWGLPASDTWGGRLQLPVKNSGLYASSVFRKLCDINGISIPAPERGQASRDFRSLVLHESRELKHILKEMLSTSDNLTAEITGTIASSKLQSAPYKTETPVEDFFRKKFPSVNWDGFRMLNSSGLTDRNMTTPEQAAAMLLYLDSSRKDGFTLRKMLPLSADSGTMRTRLDTPDTAYRVYAKTGNIYYASALAGEFIAMSGKRYLFSIFINSRERRKAYSSTGNSSIDNAREADRWSKGALKSIDTFITQQIKNL